MSEEKNKVNGEICNIDKSKSSTDEEKDKPIKTECSISKWYCNVDETNNSINQYYQEIRIQARGLLFLSLLICVVGVVLFVLCINSSVQENKVHVSIIVFGVICGMIMQLVAGMLFGGYKQTLRELNVIYDRMVVADRYALALRVAEALSDQEDKNEAYKEIIEHALQDAAQLLEGIDGNN